MLSVPSERIELQPEKHRLLQDYLISRTLPWTLVDPIYYPREGDSTGILHTKQIANPITPLTAASSSVKYFRSMALTKDFSNWFRTKIRDDIRSPNTRLGENLHASRSVVSLRALIVPDIRHTRG
jgi:hypothetical protein